METRGSVYLPGCDHHAFFFCTPGVGFGSCFFDAEPLALPIEAAAMAGCAPGVFDLHRSARASRQHRTWRCVRKSTLARWRSCMSIS